MITKASVAGRVWWFMQECRLRGLKVRYIKMSYDEFQQARREVVDAQMALNNGRIRLVKGDRWTV